MCVCRRVARDLSDQSPLTLPQLALYCYDDEPVRDLPPALVDRLETLRLSWGKSTMAGPYEICSGSLRQLSLGVDGPWYPRHPLTLRCPRLTELTLPQPSTCHGEEPRLILHCPSLRTAHGLGYFTHVEFGCPSPLVERLTSPGRRCLQQHGSLWPGLTRLDGVGADSDQVGLLIGAQSALTSLREVRRLSISAVPEGLNVALDLLPSLRVLGFDVSDGSAMVSLEDENTSPNLVSLTLRSPHLAHLSAELAMTGAFSLACPALTHLDIQCAEQYPKGDELPCPAFRWLVKPMDLKTLVLGSDIAPSTRRSLLRDGACASLRGLDVGRLVDPGNFLETLPEFPRLRVLMAKLVTRQPVVMQSASLVTLVLSGIARSVSLGCPWLEDIWVPSDATMPIQWAGAPSEWMVSPLTGFVCRW
ncbi:hypothetical protein PAPYR_10106 [Paratrimastix pyriformis]|uniref:Uncharacterized protein n=1 Tax=Paratrimastix pyriformis TaxID=342808 RepID=A0ABQ8U9J7_9EUKA|nr:hypothetical protein PAPYR_10106 [Paratrimastix pyriformis]